MRSRYDGNTALDHILVEVAQERAYQDRRWGGPTHDDQHTNSSWLSIMSNLVAKHVADPRALFVKVAATAVAAIESYDRKHQYDRFEKVDGVDVAPASEEVPPSEST
jgi:hypothetical protein